MSPKCLLRSPRGRPNAQWRLACVARRATNMRVYIKISIFIFRVYNSYYQTYPSLIHANGPVAKEILPWFESMEKQCKMKIKFTEPFPELRTLPNGFLKLIFRDRNHFGISKNLNKRELIKEKSCIKSYR